MTNEEKKIAKKILIESLWGVHKPLLNKHYSFEDRIIHAMNEFRKLKNQ